MSCSELICADMNTSADVSVANGTGSGDAVFVGSGSGEGTGFLVGDST